jgi:hypothetical protein
MPETYVPEEFKMGSWILKTELSSGAKLTFSVLAICAGGRDFVWPSQEYLAQAVSASVRSVQRYLKELAEFGLIRIGKKRLMGQTRTIYSFLNHALVSFEPKASATAQKTGLKKAEKTAPARAPKTAQPGDKNGVSYKEEESNLENNKITPPSPPKVQSPAGAELLTAEADCGEDEVWRRAKGILAEKLKEVDLKAWIEPLVFEKSDCQAVLRVPNAFFLNHIKQKFGVELREAFQDAGIPALHFDLLTPEQQARLDEQAQAAAKAKEKAEQAATTAAVESERRSKAEIENLPPESKFNLLFSVYPVDKAKDEAEKVFLHLYKKGELPPMSELFKSIKEHQSKDRWWREKMPPLLSNWLSKKKWRDKPYV